MRLAIVLSLSLMLSPAKPLYPGTPPSRSAPQDRKPTRKTRAVPAPSAQAHPQPASSCQALYEKGLLTITAQNVTLAEVLDRVHDSTGAVVDLAAGIDMRITVSLGPKPPAKVIAELLEGLPLNYVIFGASQQPGPLVGIQVMREPATQAKPGAPATDSMAEQPAARAKALFGERTGGDEGEWDEESAPSKPRTATPLAPPAVPPADE